jgi:hypothetical protein
MTALTFSEVRDLTVLLCRERGNSAAHALLWEFGYKLADLPERHYAEFAAIAKHLIDDPGIADYREEVRREMLRHAVASRGVPVEDKPAETLGDLLRQARAKLETPPFSVRVGATEKKLPPLPGWNKQPDFDPWKGFFTEPADMADWQDTYYPR